MSDIQAAVGEIKSAIAESKQQTLTSVEQKLAEMKEFSTKAQEAKDAEIKQLTEDLVKKGQTIGEILEEVKELKAGKGRFAGSGIAEVKSTQEIIGDDFAKVFNELKGVSVGNALKMEHKAVGTMTSATNSASGFVMDTRSGIYAARGRRRSRIRDLVQVVPTSTGSWEFWRQNTPAGEGSFAFQTTHGSLKSQLDYDYTKVLVTAEFLAGFVVIAKQMLQDLPFMQTQVTNDLVEDYNRAESGAFFNQLTAAATGNATAAQSVYAEKIIQWIANLLEADREPNGIVTSANNWATLMNTKPADYGLPGGGNSVTIGADGTVYFLGIPVYVANSAYIGTARTLIGDFNYAKILQVEGLNTNIYEQDSDNVRRNLVTVKTEARVALAILRPDAFIYGTGS